MAGTRAGGLKSAAKIKKERGKDFYKVIGAEGGKLGTTGGFAAGEEGRKRASEWGRIGGSRSKPNRNKQA